MDVPINYLRTREFAALHGIQLESLRTVVRRLSESNVSGVRNWVLNAQCLGREVGNTVEHLGSKKNLASVDLNRVIAFVTLLVSRFPSVLCNLTKRCRSPIFSSLFLGVRISKPT